MARYEHFSDGAVSDGAGVSAWDETSQLPAHAAILDMGWSDSDEAICEVCGCRIYPMELPEWTDAEVAAELAEAWERATNAEAEDKRGRRAGWPPATLRTLRTAYRTWDAWRTTLQAETERRAKGGAA